MKMGLRQLVCFAMGVLLLSLGGGLLGGRLAIQSRDDSVMKRSSGVPSISGESGTAEPPAAATTESEPAAGRHDAAAPFPSTMKVGQLPPSSHAPPESTSSRMEAEGEAAPSMTVEKEQPFPPSRPSKYVVQAISTSNSGDARIARKKIVAGGFAAGIFEADLGEKGRWYRVYVGPYDTEAEARVALESVREIPGFKASFVKSLE